MKFAFGQNWKSFSENALDQRRIEDARRDFHLLLPAEKLAGKSFLDIGFGQGLGLFMAMEDGADALGIEVDADNIAALKTTGWFFNVKAMPRTEIGSILDPALVGRLSAGGGFDVVHSWGVLHHTGSMWKAVENAASLVKPGGLFAVSIYRRHWTSPLWLALKWTYNKGPRLIRPPMVAIFYALIYAAKWWITGENPKKMRRGMDFYHDIVDWVGGYPYEWASAEEVRAFFGTKGFTEIFFRPAQVPTGCNQFVFEKKRG